MRDDARAEHVLGEGAGLGAPQGKHGLEPGVDQPGFTIGADVLEEEVAKDHALDALAAGVLDEGAHALLILGVGTRVGQLDDGQGQVEGASLAAQELDADAVHGDALDLGVDRRQQSDDLEGGILAGEVEGVGAVFAAAPAHQGLGSESHALILAEFPRLRAQAHGAGDVLRPGWSRVFLPARYKPG